MWRNGLLVAGQEVSFRARLLFFNLTVVKSKEGVPPPPSSFTGFLSSSFPAPPFSLQQLSLHM